MGIISLASGNSCWRGLDYYKNKKEFLLNAFYILGHFLINFNLNW